MIVKTQDVEIKVKLFFVVIISVTMLAQAIGQRGKTQLLFMCVLICGANALGSPASDHSATEQTVDATCRPSDKMFLYQRG